MSEEIKEPPKHVEKKIFANANGKYVLIDGTKAFSFEFPINSSLEDNLEAMNYLRDQLVITLAEKEKAAKEKVEEKKEPEIKEDPQETK